MKLRTKLVLVSATVLFLASGLSGAAMMADTLRFHEVQAAESGRAQLTAAANAIGSQMESSRILEYGEVTITAYFHFLWTNMMRPVFSFLKTTSFCAIRRTMNLWKAVRKAGTGKRSRVSYRKRTEDVF